MGKVKATLKDLQVRPSKQRGQNFLINPEVIDNILQFGNPIRTEPTLEIGPGLGALTEVLVTKVDSLTVIEIEEKFCDDLAERFPSLEVVQADVRTVEFSEFGGPFVVFGNLPYVYSTDILFHLIRERAAVSRAILLLQKEFAERVAASPGGRDYGVLSIMAQLWCEVRLGPIVPGHSFHPPTKVQSRLLELQMLSSPKVEVSDESFFRTVVMGAFHQRRKKIHNSLKAYGAWNASTVDEALKKAEIDPNRRAETLSLQEFSLLTAVLSPK